MLLAPLAHYLLNFGTEAQKLRWLPGMVSGEIVVAIAINEAASGPDLRSMRTRADWRGDSYVISGVKTIVAGGPPCDAVVVLARTDPAAGTQGMSLFIVDTATPGVGRGPLIEESDTEGQALSTISFVHCSVPPDGLLGGVEGRGVVQLSDQLAFERAQIALWAACAMERAFGVPLREDAAGHQVKG
jgi:acyl-CoA dehydrogenase